MIKITDITQIRGNFIVASPMMLDERFIDTVIFICEFTPNGAYGLVINDFINEKSNKLKATIFENEKIFNGGPVDNEKMFVLHSNDYESIKTLKISHNIYLTSVEDMVKNTEKLPQKYIILEGYTKWQESQLEKEIMLGNWLVYLSNDSKTIFEQPYESKWKKITQQLGIHESKYASHVGLT